jgi:menaquinone-9 beta-reductase
MNMKRDYVIIGGGVAGLSAAIRLTELGAYPLVIEAGKYPSHKVCGEFFAPESLVSLKRWNINPIEIQEAHFHVGSERIKYRFPAPAGSLSHLILDPLLALQSKGTTILTETRVKNLTPGTEMHEVELSTGELIQTPNLIIATGRIPHIKQAQPKVKYIGLKAHFEGLPTDPVLKMFLCDRAYLGISPIEDNKFNVACLVRSEKYQEWNSPSAFMQHLREQNAQLDQILSKGISLFADWMTASIPQFGLKSTPDWPHVYFIGDAIGSIPPITGNGLTFAIKSGKMAAEYAIDRKFKDFKKAWRKQSSSPIFWGNILHKISMHPLMATQLVHLGQKYPQLVDRIFHWTH